MAKLTLIKRALFPLFLCFPAHASSWPSYSPRQDHCAPLLENEYYDACYSPTAKTSFWTIHTLSASMIEGSVARTNNYHSDERLSDGPEATSYRYSGFDRGHLAPAADMKFDSQSMSESFLMTNMAPQRPAFNRGIWLKIEKAIRRDVIEYGEAIVVTGAFLHSSLPLLDSGVAIPEYFYKIIYWPSKNVAKSYLITNQGYSQSDASDFLVSVDDIESLTGEDFFYQLDDSEEEAMESALDSSPENS